MVNGETYIYFTNIAAMQNVEALQQNWLYEIIGVYVTDVSKCHTAGTWAWINTHYVQKHISALAMSNNPGPVRDKPLGTPASVKLVYWDNLTKSFQQCWYRFHLFAVEVLVTYFEIKITYTNFSNHLLS